MESGGTSKLDVISPGRALLDLSSSSLNLGTHREHSLDHLAGIVDDIQAFRLSWGDPHEAIHAVRAAL